MPEDAAANRRRRRRATAPAGAPSVQPPVQPSVQPSEAKAGTKQPAQSERSAPPQPPAAAPPKAAAARRRRPGRDAGGGSERMLRDLVGSGHSQVGVSGALRARDVNRPTEDDIAEAEREIEIVRRNWRPEV